MWKIQIRTTRTLTPTQMLRQKKNHKTRNHIHFTASNIASNPAGSKQEEQCEHCEMHAEKKDEKGHLREV